MTDPPISEGDNKNGVVQRLEQAKSRLETQAMQLMHTCEELSASRDAAIAASDRKSAFIANASHEMRTPLSGVIGLTEMVLDTDLTDEQRENLNAVKNCAESLLLVLNDILDLSKIEAGKLDLESIPFSLRQMLRDLVKPLEIRAAAKRLRLEFHVADDVPDCLLGDPGRLRQILTNLAGNAVKFTETGGITISVEMASRSGSKALFRFSVSDTGIGIPRDKQKIVFEPFRQADQSTGRKYGGTGLGLSISSKFVELVGGKLEMSSEPGQGSRFWFMAPLAIDAPASCPILEVAPGCSASCASCLIGVRVLLAEDHPVNQKIAVRLLEKQGCLVTTAVTGPEALAALDYAEFDVVLMDVQLPEMDGLAATAAIRVREQSSGKHLPVIAMTAHALKGDRERCLAAGMDGYVSKPIRMPALVDAMVAALCPATDAPFSKISGSH